MLSHTVDFALPSNQNMQYIGNIAYCVSVMYNMHMNCSFRFYYVQIYNYQ